MDNLEVKDFQGWIVLKERLHNIDKPRFIHEGDIWWYAAGDNIRMAIGMYHSVLRTRRNMLP